MVLSRCRRESRAETLAEGRSLMSAETFLSHLDKVRQTGPGRWIACCPAHDDKHPSFNIRELDDGRVLINCKAGCSTEEIEKQA